MGKFVIRETNTGIKFDLKAGNGEVIATSEVYASAAACRKGIGAVIHFAVICLIYCRISITIVFVAILRFYQLIYISLTIWRIAAKIVNGVTPDIFSLIVLLIRFFP